jgi:hypothetical protein
MSQNMAGSGGGTECDREVQEMRIEIWKNASRLFRIGSRAGVPAFPEEIIRARFLARALFRNAIPNPTCPLNVFLIRYRSFPLSLRQMPPTIEGLKAGSNDHS